MTRTLVTAAHILAGDAPREGPTAFLVADGTVTWVGDRAKRPRRKVDQTVELADAWVMPGFVDPHIHLSAYAVLPGWVDVSAARTVADLTGKLREGARRAPEGTWVVGWGFRELVTPFEKRLTRSDLDAALPDRPCLVVHSSFHSSVANSAALARVGFGRWTPRSPGGELERDRRGEPNGRAWERAHAVLEWAARRTELDVLGEGWSERVRATAGQLLAEGLTHVGDAAMSPRERDMAERAQLPIGVTAMTASGGGMLGRLDEVLDGPRTGEGTSSFRIGPVKLFADGGERCAMLLSYPVILRAFRGLATANTGLSNPIESLRVLRPRFDSHGVHTGTLHYRGPDLAGAMARASSRGFGTSDGPTALWEPLPIMRLAVERRTEEGLVIRPDQALTREEALRAATVTAAEAAGVGDEKGQIAPGKQADFVVLTGDPFDAETRVSQTWVSGRKVWGAEGPATTAEPAGPPDPTSGG